MQEEVTRGAVTLIVDGAKLSEQVFEKAVKKFQMCIRDRFCSNTPDCPEALVTICYQFLHIAHAFYACHHSSQSINTGLHP